MCFLSLARGVSNRSSILRSGRNKTWHWFFQKAYVEKSRWPNCFVCPCCGNVNCNEFLLGSFKMFQCKACRHQTSLIAGTLFQSTKLPHRLSDIWRILSFVLIGDFSLILSQYDFSWRRQPLGHRLPVGCVQLRYLANQVFRCT